jgi:16S rRNA (guanine527-N7)-methyltransferase
VAELLPGLSVPPATLDRLWAFDAALARWSAAINLVAPATLADSWNRHILDSAQLFTLAPVDARHWADLGSGGGLPGLVIAILGQERGLSVTLVESDRRKAAFLRAQIAEHALGARVETARAEALAPLGADVVTARALAPLDRLLPMVTRHLAPGGTALLPKGRRWATELAAAQTGWSFDCEDLPSAMDPDARILRMTRIRPTA